MPDIARDRLTDKIISAIELRYLQDVHNQRFECHACAVTMLPASYDIKVNLKRPYFRLFKDTDHDKNCGAEKAKKAKARIHSVTTKEGFPYPYPNELVLWEETRSATPTGRGVVCPVGTSGPIVGKPEDKGEMPEPHKIHNHTTTTIRPLAQTYLDYPFDREHLALIVPGVRGRNYEEIFRYLFFTDDSSFSEPKIFYGSIRFSRIRVQEDFAEVELSEGKWEKVEGKNRLVRPQTVRIHTKGWAKLMRDSLVDELEITRREIIDAHAKGDKKTKGWLFFLGWQDSVDKFLFHVSDHRLVCCFADLMVKKSRPILSTSQNSNIPPRVAAKTSLAPPQPVATPPKVEEPKPLSVFGGIGTSQTKSNHRSSTAGAVTQAPHPQVIPIKKLDVTREREMPPSREATNSGVKPKPTPIRVAATDVPARGSHARTTTFRRVTLWLRRLIGQS